MEKSVFAINQALRHLGQSKQIASATERSKEAEAANQFYEDALVETLRDAKLPVTRRYTTLALVANNPTPEFLFSYRYPSDCAAVMALVPVGVVCGAPYLDYKTSSDDEGRLILTNVSQAMAEYVHIIDDFEILGSDVRLAFSYKLAQLMGPSITGGDGSGLVTKAENNYFIAINKAVANGMNEQTRPRSPRSQVVAQHDVIGVRECSYPVSGRE